MNPLSYSTRSQRTNNQAKSKPTSSASSRQENVSLPANTLKNQPSHRRLHLPSGYGSRDAASRLSAHQPTKAIKASSSHQSIFEKYQSQRSSSGKKITSGTMIPVSRSRSGSFLDLPHLPSRTDSEIVAGMHKYTDWREYRRALDNYELRQEELSLAFENNEITLEEYQLFSANDQKPTYIGKKIDQEAAFRRIFGF